jgi:hypothetical protein
VHSAGTGYLIKQFGRGGYFMYRIDKVKRAAISLMFVVALAAHASTEAQGATCDEGTAVPPFLGVETVPPNLMLMIDNSGSMYDLNYWRISATALMTATTTAPPMPATS